MMQTTTASPISVSSDIQFVENFIAAKKAALNITTANDTTTPNVPAPEKPTSNNAASTTEKNTPPASGNKQKELIFLDQPKKNGTTFGDKVAKQAKDVGVQFGTSLVTGFISNGLGQVLRKGGLGGNSADGVGGTVSTAFKVGALTAVEVDEIKKEKKAAAIAANNGTLPPVENDVFPSNPGKSTRRRKMIKLLVPTLISGAVASAAGLGVLGLVGSNLAGFTLSGVAGTVAWNRSETALQRNLFGIGVRNVTADPRSRGERIKDTTIGLIPNMVGGALGGAVGGGIFLKAAKAAPIVKAFGDKGAELFGETIGTAVAGVVQDKSVTAVREMANKIDVPFTEIMRGGHTVINPETGESSVSHEPITSSSPRVLTEVQDDISVPVVGAAHKGRISVVGRIR
ncbi:hypothetical protein BDF22DRAFT_654616 [Syncephalis plumigaleata]|nr:hypothetical protein BDF22DRAFT_654616 [Syncephalis plumigaleata]